MKKLKCECCGAPLNVSYINNYRTNISFCEYCGSKYRLENETVIRVENFHNPIRTLISKVELPEEDIRAIGEEKMSEIAIRNLTRNLAESLAPMMTVEKTYDPMTMRHLITAKVRVVEADYRF